MCIKILVNHQICIGYEPTQKLENNQETQHLAVESKLPNKGINWKKSYKCHLFNINVATGECHSNAMACNACTIHLVSAMLWESSSCRALNLGSRAHHDTIPWCVFCHKILSRFASVRYLFDIFSIFDIFSNDRKFLQFQSTIWHHNLSKAFKGLAPSLGKSCLQIRRVGLQASNPLQKRMVFSGLLEALGGVGGGKFEVF